MSIGWFDACRKRRHLERKRKRRLAQKAQKAGATTDDIPSGASWNKRFAAVQSVRAKGTK